MNKIMIALTLLLLSACASEPVKFAQTLARGMGQGLMTANQRQHALYCRSQGGGLTVCN